MPDPKAVFYLLQFPSNFLCRPGLDLTLTLDVLCVTECPPSALHGGPWGFANECAFTGLGGFNGV
jgi:hypothetical protein